ncbi:MAG: phytoene desaturase family protein [Flavobacteriales bacterium]|jgi:phytoene desaturase|nr:phytoene desaturase family protein [Flavobacteriales bacterium]
MQKVIIIGAGFSSLSTACYLAKEGYQVTVFEKQNYVGGRARQLKKEGFTFDMGPTFYWMPDVFDAFFEDFGRSTNDFYELNKLATAYRVIFENEEVIDIEDHLDKIAQKFEEIEKGSGAKLKKFIAKAKENYELAIQDLVYQPGENLFEIINGKTATKLPLFIQTIAKQVSQVVQDEKLRMILQFPILFLGATPKTTPSFYNFMNYADFGLGTWYPEGGMYEVAQGMYRLAKDLNVKFILNAQVNQILEKKGKAIGISLKDESVFYADIIISGADYHFTEQIIPKKFRQYSDAYWRNKTFAPSALLFYVGFKAKLPNLEHHTLFFDTDFDEHIQSIYGNPSWPKSPLFYASFPSISDSTVAPEGNEAGIFLIPLATHLDGDDESTRKTYLHKILARLSKQVGRDLKEEILFYESFCVKEFKEEYSSYGGNAYGLANTLMQTHILRPKLKSKKLKNLFFTGQLTVPGPGVPPAIISGKVVASLVQKYHPNITNHKIENHERTV